MNTLRIVRNGEVIAEKPLAEEEGLIRLPPCTGEEKFEVELEDFALPAGVYTSLRITLGAGAGRNWWCVVYPPLCSQEKEKTAEAAALLGEELSVLRDEGAGWEIRFRVLDWWGELLS